MATNVFLINDHSQYAVIGLLALACEESKNFEHGHEPEAISDEDFKLRQLAAEFVSVKLITAHVNTKTCDCVGPSSIPGDCDECDEFMSTLTENIVVLSLACVRECRAE